MDKAELGVSYENGCGNRMKLQTKKLISFHIFEILNDFKPFLCFDFRGQVNGVLEGLFLPAFWQVAVFVLSGVAFK